MGFRATLNFRKLSLSLLGGVNQGFWPHLGCSGQNTTIFSQQSIFQGEFKDKIKKNSHKSRVTPRLVSFTGLIQFFSDGNPFHMGVSPCEDCSQPLSIFQCTQKKK